MLRRLLNTRSSSRPPDDDPNVSYVEALIDRALAADGGLTDEQALLDPMVSLGRLLCDLEVEAGLSPPPDTADQDQFIRTYIKLLLDNDRQPRALQLSASEIELPRALLQSFFTRGATMQMDATKVLRFIEARFARGNFGQARLLLQLFETDQQTRRNNERNLFFEEMVLRFLSTRNTPAHIPADSDDSGFGEVLNDNGISLNTLGHDDARVDAWRTLLPKDIDETAADAILRIIPGPRWREHWRNGDPIARLREHFAVDAAQRFVRDLTLRVYFITLYPGATGFEYLVVNYLEWMEERFEMVATRILPRLHRESTLGERSIDESLAFLVDELFENSSMETRRPSKDNVVAAFEAFEASLDDIDIADVAAAEYDLGGLVSFDLFDFPAGALETRFRLSRLA